MAGDTYFQQPPEMQLLGVLSRATAIGSSARDLQAEVAALSSAVGSWDYFLLLSQHHRIAPIIARAITVLSLPLPEDVVTQLRQHSAANAVEAFRYLAELQRVLQLFREAGIEATVLKGVPLSLMAFENVALRDVGDIDLLIDPDKAETADAVLQKAGMLRQEPAAALSWKRRAFYTKYHKDYTYAPGHQGFEIDLHWRLLRDRQAAQEILHKEDEDSRTRLTLGSTEITVLAFEPCVVYLAVHGAMEGWVRWKSLVDIAALWSRATQVERDSAWVLAEQSASNAFLAAALTLAAEWLGTQFGDATGFPDDDDRMEYILGDARQRMMKTNFLPAAAAKTSLQLKWHEVRLRPSLPSLHDLVMRVLFRPRMWEALNLPDALFFLYPVFSPVEWLLFRLKRRGKVQ